MIYIICAPSAQTDKKTNTALENVDVEINNDVSPDQGKNGLMLLKCRVREKQILMDPHKEKRDKLYTCPDIIADSDLPIFKIIQEPNNDLIPNYEVKKSQKGNDIMVHNGREYIMHQKVKNILYYRCRAKECQGRGKITDNFFTVTVQHKRCTKRIKSSLKSKSTPQPKNTKQEDRIQKSMIQPIEKKKNIKSTSIRAQDANYDTSPEIEYITSQRGGYIIYYKKYLYHHSYNRRGILVYRCRMRECKGRLRVRARAVKAYRTHSHADDEAEYFKLMSRQKLKQAVLESPTTPMIKVYGEVLEDLMAKYPNIATIPDALPKYYSVEKTLMRATKTMP